MRKMLVSDYDGTLYINEEDFNKNIAAVNQFRKNGNLFVIATGRSYQDFINVTRNYHIEYDYVALNAGTCIINSDHEYLITKIIDHSTVTSIYNELIDHPSLLYITCSQNKVLLFSNFEKNVDINNPEICKIILHLLPDEITEAAAIVDDLKTKYNIKAYLLTHDDYIEVEVIPSDCDKSIQVEYLSKLENIDRSNIFTIGDSANDIGMVKQFNGACMTSSLPDLLALNKPMFDSVSDFIKTIEKKL